MKGHKNFLDVFRRNTDAGIFYLDLQRLEVGWGTIILNLQGYPPSFGELDRISQEIEKYLS